MRLLVVMSSYPFLQRVSSEIIAYHNIKELSKKHSIYFVCLDRNVVNKQGDLAEFTEKIEFVSPEKTPRLITLCRYIFYMLLGYPTTVTAYMSSKMRKRVKELTENNKFDAILLYGINTIQYCPSSSYKKVIVNIEDPLSIKLKRMNRLSIWSLWQKIKLFVHTQLSAQYEKKFLPKMAKVLLFSEADMTDMREQGGYNNIGCVSYCVTPRPPKKIIGYEGRTKDTIIFSGNMFHKPNIDGILFFLKDIFPLVLQKYSIATLWIVGAEPDKRIRDAAAFFGDHIVMTGRVNDISEYLQRAKVSICPVRLKIGIQTKILEALSWGTPVVTTSAGNSGVRGCSGHELWVEDEPDMFANRVVALLHGESWHQLSEEGRKLVEERFSCERSAMEIEHHIMSIQTAIER